MQDPTAPDRNLGDARPSSTASQASPPTDAAKGVRDQAREVAGQAADQASSLAGQVKDRAVSAVEGRKSGIADQVEDAAQAVHRSGEQLRGQSDWLASAVERGASELSSFASSLRDKDAATLVSEVQGFARRQPAAFIGASFAAGFALARLGKLVATDISKDDLPALPEISHGQG